MTWLDRKIASETAPGAPTTPSRVIGTAFQPSTTQAVLCIYTISFALTHGQAGGVVANCDSMSTPTTEVGEVGGAVTDDNAAVTVVTQLVVLCPAGNYVKLVANGTGTPTITAQQETPIN